MLDRKNYPSIDLCYICDGSLNTTFGLFPNITSEDFDFEQDVIDNKRRACWKHGEKKRKINIDQYNYFNLDSSMRF